MTTHITRQGWLLAQPSMANEVLGIAVPPETRTRKEEYNFVVDALSDLSRGLLLDSATGYLPEWHRMAPILARDGWTVVATDMEPGVLTLLPDPRVHYAVADSRYLPLPDGLFDAAICVSTLEHVIVIDAFRIVAELYRCVKPGGRIVITGDNSPWLPCLFGGVLDQTPAPAGGCDPQVYYVVVEI